MKTVDVGAAIDEGRWTGYQKLLIAGTALTIILDGVDNQLLPNAVPRLIAEWERPRADFITALSIGPFGMMIGGLIGGVLGDRLGRRTALLGSVLAFAVLTLAIAFVNSIEMLALLRFLAGVGLGGPLGPRMEQHLAPLPRPAQRLPLAIVGVNRFHRLMHTVVLHVRGPQRLGFTRSSSAPVHRATHPSRLAGVITSSAVRGVNRARASQQRSRARAICRSVWSTCIARPRS